MFYNQCASVISGFQWPVDQFALIWAYPFGDIRMNMSSTDNSTVSVNTTVTTDGDASVSTSTDGGQ